MLSRLDIADVPDGLANIILGRLRRDLPHIHDHGVFKIFGRRIILVSWDIRPRIELYSDHVALVDSRLGSKSIDVMLQDPDFFLKVIDWVTRSLD